jgi:endonuclease YncB( thermonuclease family)
MRTISCFISALLLVLLSGSKAHAFIAVFEKAISGDTLLVREEKTDSPVIVRLYGIDAPDEGQLGFDTAREFLSSEMKRTNTYIHIVPAKKGYDVFGRVQAFVFKDNVSMNHLVVKEGMAMVLGNNCTLKDCENIIHAEQEAKDQRKGIWWLGDADKPWIERDKSYVQFINKNEGYYEGIFYFKNADGKIVAADPAIRCVVYEAPPPPPTRIYVPVQAQQQQQQQQVNIIIKK